jgi:hypothetical protein
MNNPEQIDINSLNVQQLEQMIHDIQLIIGDLEIQKQMHVQNIAVLINRYTVLKKQQETPMAKLPNLKKITLPKANNEQASYTLNKT